VTSTGGVTLFDTAIGQCGLAWGEHGVSGVQLPEADTAATCARLHRRFPAMTEGPPPGGVRTAIEGIVALLAGQPADLTAVTLDLGGVPEFHRRVYAVARTIPCGHTLSYGEVARRLGDPGAARAVGQALGRNPFPVIVPCHRVLAAGGRMGGFSAAGGAATKRRMLAIEGAPESGGRPLFDAEAYQSATNASGGPMLDAAGPSRSTYPR
jgi:methylated-DNA-[protein]-cysteine S-methyltransferase